MRKFLAVLALMLASIGASAQLSYYSDHSVGISPFGSIVGYIPIQYGQVRVCSWPGASGIPCSPLATVYDKNNNQLFVQGGNFGQLTTDVTGLFTFGCKTGSYFIQVQ